MSNYENKKVRGYQLNVTIGSGGFGTVYHAFQEVLSREVAVKVIKEKYVNDPQFVRQFEAEARIIARLEHFNIVTLYDYWRDPRGAYLVMRWLRGGSLRSFLKQTSLDVAQIVRIINQIAAALAFAHQHNVIHRDIKPENILLDNDGNAFLTDFGIAVDLRNQDNVDVENLSFGSPDYVAPEQLKERIITPRSDIYSLGIMLYELLANQRPFVSKDPKEIMKMQLYNPVPSLRLKRPDLPAEIDTVIWQATAKNPAHRYDNVLELAVAFQDIAQKMESVPDNYIISTRIHTRVSPEPADDIGNMPTENLITGAIPDDVGDALATGVLPGNEKGIPQFAAQIETIPDALPTNLMEEDDNIDTADDAFNTLIQADNEDYPEAEIPDETEHIGTLVAAGEPEDAGGDTAELEDAFSLMTMTIDGESPPNPYKGLHAFEEADEGTFFGREEIVSRLVDDFSTRKSRFLTLIGPSGSGKSSVVKAGMIPAFRRGAVPGSDRWFYTEMTPGDDPFRQLSEAILRVAIHAPENWSSKLEESPKGLHKLLGEILPDDASEVFLFIDQFEETFTLGDDEARRSLFLDSLWYALNQDDSRLRVISTLRADFYDRPLHYPQFGQMLKANTEVILPLNLQELEMAIIGPAGRVGLVIEPALKNAILNDVYNQPGALPLLQYALTELYDRKPDHMQYLSNDQYREIGGIEGALAKRADEIYEKLNSEEQNITRKLFLRIIAIDENGSVTRRRLLWTEMMSGIENPETLNNVLDAFSKHRLLTRDRDRTTSLPTIEVAHEAIISSWQKLRDWIEKNRTILQRRQELRVEVDTWLNNKRDKSYLASGSRLGEFESLLTNELLALREEEQDYLTESVLAREASALRAKRINAALSIFSVVTMILLGLSLFAFRRANNATLEAQESARIARSRELAASSVANLEQTDLALLLAVEAINIRDTYEAENSLLLALQENPLVRQYLHGHSDEVRSVDYNSTGDIAVSAGLDRSIIRWNTITGEIIGDPLTGHDSWITRIQISPDDSLIASGSDDGTVRLWNLETGEEIAVFTGHTDTVWTLDFSPDGRLLATAGEDGRILIWDVESQSLAREIDAIPSVEDETVPVIVYSLDFDSTGNRLVSGSGDNIVRTWDVQTGDNLLTVRGHNGWVRSVQFDPTDNAIISGDVDGILFFINPQNGELLSNPLSTGLTEGISDMSYSHDGLFLATSGFDGRIIVWSLQQRGSIVAVITAHRDRVWSVDFHPGEYSLISASSDRNVIVSELSAIMEMGTFDILTNQTIAEFAYDNTGQRFIFAGAPSDDVSAKIQVWSESGEGLYELNISDISESTDIESWQVTDLAVSPDGSKLAVSIASGEIILLDMSNGETLWISSHEVYASSVEFTPDSSRLISSDELGIILIWDVETGEAIETAIYAMESGVTAMSISPDGQYLSIGGRDGMYLWDFANETLISDSMDGHNNAISTLIFTNDSQTLISGGRDREIVLWSIEGEEIQRFEGHQDWVLSLAVNPADNLLVSGDRTGAIYLWDLNTGFQIGNPLLGPDGWLTGLYFVDDTTILASNRENSVTMRWTVDPDDLLALACSISNRQLTESEWMQFLPDTSYNPGCAPLEESAQEE